jgi:hypothetical protein
LEQQITEQEGLIESMKMVMELTAAEQGTLIHITQLPSPSQHQDLMKQTCIVRKYLGKTGSTFSEKR